MKSNKLNTFVDKQKNFFLKEIYSIICQHLAALKVSPDQHLFWCYHLTKHLLLIIFKYLAQDKELNLLSEDYIADQLSASSIHKELHEYRILFTGPLLKQLLTFLSKYSYLPEQIIIENNNNLVTPYVFSLNYEYFSLCQDESNKIAASGTFYTQYHQIDIINQLALGNYLTACSCEEDKSLIVKLLFASTREEKLNYLKEKENQTLINTLKESLTKVKILDPACGTGSFLVNLVEKLYDLNCCCLLTEPAPDQSFELLKTIIEQNLHGVDIDPEACEITKIRLYLLLIKYLPYKAQSLKSINYQIFSADSLQVDWEETFSSIFKTENAGFDLITGNPPYVRQEFISDPHKKISNQDYKKNIAISIYQNYPDYFHYDKNKNFAQLPMNAKADLYMYFYFLALKLLKDGGSVCYISSNSWLDVDYGQILRDFLLKHATINLILEDLGTSAFSLADVNTAIFLGTKSSELNKHSFVHFVSFKQLFDHQKFASLLTSLPQTNQLEENDSFRIYSINQKDLLTDSLNHNRLNNTSNAGITNKWGGYYLRSPSIYWKIINKCQNKLVKLNDVATIKFGIKSGANDFFYLTQKTADQWKIETEFLKPFLYSLKEVENYEVNPLLLENKLFCCYQTKEELEDSGKVGALNYIHWGESQNYHQRPSVSRRPQWYYLPVQDNIHFVSNRFLGERIAYPWIENISVCDVFFVGAITSNNPLLTVALLNSSLSLLSTEILARKTYSIGVAYMYGPELKLVDLVNPEEIPQKLCNDIIETFNFMRNRKLLKLEDEFLQTDRQKLDELIFNYLGFSSATLESVRESLVKMVKMRLRKN